MESCNWVNVVHLQSMPAEINSSQTRTTVHFCVQGRLRESCSTLVGCLAVGGKQLLLPSPTTDRGYSCSRQRGENGGVSLVASLQNHGTLSYWRHARAAGGVAPVAKRLERNARRGLRE